jgi:hypothetical protein
VILDLIRLYSISRVVFTHDWSIIELFLSLLFLSLLRRKICSDAFSSIDLLSSEWHWIRLCFLIVQSRNSWLCSFTNYSIWTKNSTIRNTYLLRSLIVYKCDNLRHISASFLWLVINNIIYLDIYKYDECSNALKLTDREFLLWCSILIDRIQILIISFWRIKCFQSSQISLTAFHQMISFDFELRFE